MKEKNKSFARKLKPYNTSRIKSLNFLTNIWHAGVKEEDLYDRNFVFDTHVLVTKNINPFSLERKIYDVKDREMMQMFWSLCIDQYFYKHICEPENFMYLNGKKVLILVWRKLFGKTFKRQKNFVKMRNKFIENQKIFQFAYSYSYPEIYTFVENRGIGIRKEFHVKFKTWKDKKKQPLKTFDKFKSAPVSPSPSPPLFGAVQKKLTTKSDFEEEKHIAEKQKEMEGKKSMKQQRRREIAAKNKELRRVKKAEKEKILWGRLQ